VAERPILFQGAMVRALLAGTKTQTRRALKPQPPKHTVAVGRWQDPPGYDAAYWAFVREGPVEHDHPFGGAEIHGEPWRAAFGQPGDRLWVRETWAPEQYDAHATSIVESETSTRKPAYRADFVGEPAYKWKPSIHMPRAASRITLEVVGVRVERLHEISTADCYAEGAPGGHSAIPGYAYDATPLEHYRHVWNSINGPGSWDANPWVWVIEFRRADTATSGVAATAKTADGGVTDA
jgi:hypothetical protein